MTKNEGTKKFFTIGFCTYIRKVPVKQGTCLLFFVSWGISKIFKAYCTAVGWHSLRQLTISHPLISRHTLSLNVPRFTWQSLARSNPIITACHGAGRLPRMTNWVQLTCAGTVIKPARSPCYYSPSKWNVARAREGKQARNKNKIKIKKRLLVHSCSTRVNPPVKLNFYLFISPVPSNGRAHRL
jgi:hypothetical protein